MSSPTKFELPPSRRDWPGETPDGGKPNRSATFRWLAFLLMLLGLLVLAGWALSEPIQQAWYVQSSRAAFSQGRYDEAEAKATEAIERFPEYAPAYEERLRARIQLRNYSGAREDADKLLAINPTHGQAYYWRSMIRQKLGDLPGALEDIDRAILWSSETQYSLLNDRAYFRALARTELAAADEDINKALAMLGEDLQRVAEGSERQHVARRLHLRYSRAMFLDTRGYLHHLQGRHSEAVSDLDDALAIMMPAVDETLPTASGAGETGIRDPNARTGRDSQPGAGAEGPAPTESNRDADDALAPVDDPLVRDPLAEELTEYRRHLAVMHYHRSLAHAALGNEEAAAADRAAADRYGFDPADE